MDRNKLALLERLSLAANQEANLARALANTACIGSREFRDLLRQIELARAEVQRARGALDAHLQQHSQD